MLPLVDGVIAKRILEMEKLEMLFFDIVHIIKKVMSEHFRKTLFFCVHYILEQQHLQHVTLIT